MDITFALGKMLSGFSALALLPGLVLLPSQTTPASPAQPVQPVLVELFTSEGCSSCPPADRLLMELDRQQSVPGANIVVLSEHVDYWDSQGWRDPYSSHQWTERQGDYGHRFGLNDVYTPQMVIDGAHQVTGGDGHTVWDTILKSSKETKIPLTISNVERTDGKLRVTFSAGAGPKEPLYAVVADESDRSTVVHGENAGRVLDHVAVARSLTKAATLQATPLEQTIEIRIPQDNANRRLRVILFIQSGKNGHILGVAGREV